MGPPTRRLTAGQSQAASVITVSLAQPEAAAGRLSGPAAGRARPGPAARLESFSGNSLSDLEGPGPTATGQHATPPCPASVLAVCIGPGALCAAQLTEPEAEAQPQ